MHLQNSCRMLAWQWIGWRFSRCPIRLDTLSPEQLREVNELYLVMQDVRMCIRTQMTLLAAKRHLVAAQIAAIVRQGRRRCGAGSSAT